jgi:hypothetical protein
MALFMACSRRAMLVKRRSIKIAHMSFPVLFLALAAVWLVGWAVLVGWWSLLADVLVLPIAVMGGSVGLLGWPARGGSWIAVRVPGMRPRRLR